MLSNSLARQLAGTTTKATFAGLIRLLRRLYRPPASRPLFLDFADSIGVPAFGYRHHARRRQVNPLPSSQPEMQQVFVLTVWQAVPRIAGRRDQLWRSAAQLTLSS